MTVLYVFESKRFMREHIDAVGVFVNIIMSLYVRGIINVRSIYACRHSFALLISSDQGA